MRGDVTLNVNWLGGAAQPCSKQTSANRRVTTLNEERGIDEIDIDLTDLPDALDSVGHDAAGGVRAVAQEIHNNVMRATGLSCAIGATPKQAALSKIASELDKPDGLTWLTSADLNMHFGLLPVRRLNGIGPKAGAGLATLGLRTIHALAQQPPPRAMPVHCFGRGCGRWAARRSPARHIDSASCAALPTRRCSV